MSPSDVILASVSSWPCDRTNSAAASASGCEVATAFLTFRIFLPAFRRSDAA